jgi:L-cysteine S-thiosulfotransferase
VRGGDIARILAMAAMAGPLTGAPPARAADRAQIAPAQIVGDALPRSLTGGTGDVVQGRAIAFSRERGNCIACHAFGTPEDGLYGNLGPNLSGIADRLSLGQIRLAVVDGRRLNPAGLMPAYYRVDGLKRVATAYVGKPVLSAQEIEDVVAFLASLHADETR